MSTLAELVKFKNDLRDTIGNLSLESEVLEKTRLVDTIKYRHEITDYHQDLEQYLQECQNLLAKNNDIIRLIKNTIEKIIQLRIGGYSDWRFSGLQLHCRYNRITPMPDNFVNPKDRIGPMVGNDPLYLVGPDLETLTKTIANYPESYQRKIRLYEVKKRDLLVLPHAQFGFILCWDFLNYLPVSVIEWYLKSILALLRPGGILLFSYTNGNIETSASFVDQRRYCWATDAIIKKMVVDLGFDIINFIDLATNDNELTWVSWAEVKKPGNLTSVKKSQSMGQVLSK